MNLNDSIISIIILYIYYCIWVLQFRLYHISTKIISLNLRLLHHHHHTSQCCCNWWRSRKQLVRLQSPNVLQILCSVYFTKKWCIHNLLDCVWWGAKAEWLHVTLSLLCTTELKKCSMEVNVYTDKVKQYKPVYWLFGAAQSYATLRLQGLNGNHGK